MRRKGRADRNQAQIVRELRQLGIEVEVTSAMGNGFPDLVVRRGDCLKLIEIKDPLQPPSKCRLTEDEDKFHKRFEGHVHVAFSTEDVLKHIEGK